MAELDVESPGAAFARQARTESRVTAILTVALRDFLADVRRDILGLGFGMTQALVEQMWRASIDEALNVPQVDAEARAYIAEVVGESDLSDDAYRAAIALLHIAHDEGWTEGELRAEAAEVFDATNVSPGETNAALTAAGARRRSPRNGANWEALDAAAGGDWMAKMKRDARTAVTGLDGLLVSAELARQGYTQRRWVTMHDSKVRDTHRMAEGQTVPVGEPFIVGGAPLRYPGDRQGPAAEVINCRCVQVGVRWRRTSPFPQG